MSDFSYSSRSKSSLNSIRTPFKVIQPPSSFIERVNKVFSNQIFENTKKTFDKHLDSDRYPSPYTLTRADRHPNTLAKKSKHFLTSKKSLKIELASIKLNSIFKVRQKHSFNELKSKPAKDPSSIRQDLRTMIEDTFKKFLPQSQPSILTQCEKCGHVGLNFYTASTKEHFSPRFLDKIRHLLPSSLKKSLSEVSTMPISDFYPNTFSVSPFQDVSRDSLSNFSPEFSGGGKMQIPRLNFGKIACKSRYSEEVLKGSPVVNTLNVSEGVKKLEKIVKIRVHRGFDMIFLSRASHKENSLTFEFTLEESKISNDPDPLTGTFGDQHKILEISEIKKKREDSVSFENGRFGKNFKTACKILYTRLDKLFYRRKVRGFYSLVDMMY